MCAVDVLADNPRRNRELHRYAKNQTGSRGKVASDRCDISKPHFSPRRTNDSTCFCNGI